jgi:peptidyl-prolyl cis-trans isomerase SurA
MKPLKNILFLLVLIGTNLTAQEQKLIDKVIAQVGSELILLSDVENEYNYMASAQQVSDESVKCLLLEQIMASKILVTQAKLDSLEATDEEVDAQLDARMDQILRQMGGDEQLFEDYYGKTVAEMKNIYRDDIQARILTDKMQAQLIANIQITPSEVVEFFNSIPTDSLPYFNSEVEVGEILLTPEVNDREKQKARKKLEDIRRQIVEEGADFAELAKKHSDDFGSGRLGGDLGWQKRGTFVPEFEAAAYSLKKEEFSEIVETEFGFHLIQLIERRGNTIKARHILISPDITDEDIERARQKLDSIRNLIVVDSMDFTRAVKSFSDPNTPSYHNNGRMTNPVNQSTFFETKDLSPEVYFAIEDLEIGELSEVLEITGPNGETLFQLVKLISRTRPHRANLQEDYSKIQNYARESKKNEYINEWLTNKIRENYIYIDPSFSKKCPNFDKWKTF